MNKLTFSILALFVLASCSDQKASNVAANMKTYDIEQIMNNEAVGGGSFSSDHSRLIIHSNRTGIFNAYEIDISNGNSKALTSSDSTSIFTTSYFPNDDRMLLRMDNNGDEIYQIFMRDLSGDIQNLTPNPGARANFRGWSADEQSFYYDSNQRTPQSTDFYKMNIESLKSELIYENNEGLDVAEISDNEEYLALVKPVNTNDVDLFLYSVPSKEMTKINTVLSNNNAQDFSKDGKYLYYTSDYNGEFTSLMRYDIEQGVSEVALEREWDISSSYFSKSGKYRITSINKDGQTVIEVFDTEKEKNIDLPSFNGGGITSVAFSKDDSVMRFYVGDSNSPSNLFYYELESGRSQQLTDVLNPEIQPQDLVKAEVIRFASFDGLDIPAIYYLPHQASSDNPVPAMVWVHGGPGGQSRQNFNPIIQYLVNNGYAVLAVNNRGSSGYGKTFYQMDDLNHGDKDLRDCIEGKNWLAKQEVIDAEKIGIIGGSYGGYMTMAALTFAPEEFDVGVNIFGVTNWIRTLKSIPPWWASFKDALYQELGDPFSADSTRLKQISPLFHTQNVTKPLIVLQGAQDPRVLQVESDEIVAGVRSNGVPVEYVLFEDEGHGFVKKENQIEAYGKILEFLDVYLKENPGEPIQDGNVPEETNFNSPQ